MSDDIEHVALEMIKRFGDEAAAIARDLAERAEERQRDTAQAWRDIADEVERVLTRSETLRDGVENAEQCPVSVPG
jgi:Mg2+ and Co2+ transporter CorA